VGVLEPPVERRAEGLLDRALLVPERARQLAHHGVRDDHRGRLASGEHVRADRERIVGQLLAHALVDALVAPAQQGERLQPGELLRHRIVERAPGCRQHHDPARRWARRAPLAVHGAQGGIDDVDPQDHPRPAPIWRVVDLAVGERRRVAVVEEAQVMAEAQRVADVTLALEPVEPFREEGEDVDVHGASASIFMGRAPQAQST
jgi:hypothetical protein